MGNTVCLMDQYILEIRRIYEKKQKKRDLKERKTADFTKFKALNIVAARSQPKKSIRK